MPKRALGINVFEAALYRIESLYKEGHRLILSFSGGKDSGVCLELMLMAAKRTNRLPVEVVMRDEEIMFPGTFEYCERVYRRPEVKFHWLVAGQPIIHSFNRENPYWWVFDPSHEDKWVRQKPSWVIHIKEQNIGQMVTDKKFPPPAGKQLFSVLGLRTSESRNRKMGLMSSGDFVTKVGEWGVRLARPIYDWGDDDVWKSIYDNKWDYNSAYDVMHRVGMSKNKLRIAPPTMYQSIDSLKYALKAWPKWFDKVNTRVGGMRTAANFGKRAIRPIRKISESWEDCGKRIFTSHNSPEWIIKRYEIAKSKALGYHSRHSTQELAQNIQCGRCFPSMGSWKDLVENFYMGDPWSQFYTQLPYMEPEFFRKGSGYWGGKPAFA